MVAELPRSRNRPARSRREQALRAEARTASRFLRGVAQLQLHRGSQPSRLAAALARALREASAPSGQTEDAETVHAAPVDAQAEEPASSAPAAWAEECPAVPRQELPADAVECEAASATDPSAQMAEDTTGESTAERARRPARRRTSGSNNKTFVDV